MQNHPIQKSSVSPTIADPWLEEGPTQSHETVPSWQFPLDITHELEAGAMPEKLLAPETDLTVRQIPAHTDLPASTNLMAFLLKDELKIKAECDGLWNQIRDALVLMCWIG